MVSSWGIQNGDVVLNSDFQQGGMSSQSPQPVRETIIKVESDTGMQPSLAVPEASINFEPLKEVQKNTYDAVDRLAIDNASKIEEPSEIDIEDDCSSPKSEAVAKTPPFPWLAMSALCLGMLAHSVVFTNPLPFVAFMVVDFKMADSVDSAGYYAGWITGTFMIGKMFNWW
jgi:hypothetical protein